MPADEVLNALCKCSSMLLISSYYNKKENKDKKNLYSLSYGKKINIFLLFLKEIAITESRMIYFAFTYVSHMHLDSDNL